MTKTWSPFVLTVDCVACAGHVNLKYADVDGQKLDVIFQCVEEACGAETRLSGSLIEVKPSKSHLSLLRREAAAEAI